MRFLAPLLACLTLASSSFAQTAPPAEAKPSSSPKEVALDNLLSERGSEKALEIAIAAARKSDISEQAILEARFLYYVDRREDAAIAGLLPDFLKQNERFDPKESNVFSLKEDWLAVIEYVQAIASLKQGNKDAFKSHITEAFWLSPHQAAAFAPHIERMRLEEAMRTVSIDFQTKLKNLSGEDSPSLESLMAEKKALILQFWSPSNRECEASLPDYAITAKAFSDKGIAMAAVLTEDSEKILADARNMIGPLGPKPPGAWLIDAKENPLARLLRVQSMPTFVLISKEGKILFNGDPTDDGLWDALKKLDPLITRPDAPAGGE
jgi:AhpC/TSA family